METKQIVKSVLIGTIIGAAMGILLAPAKGCETRRKIYEKGEDVLNAVKNNFNVFVNEIMNKYNQLKQKLS